jgi:hypothetical protein
MSFGCNHTISNVFLVLFTLIFTNVVIKYVLSCQLIYVIEPFSSHWTVRLLPIMVFFSPLALFFCDTVV